MQRVESTQRLFSTIVPVSAVITNGDVYNAPSDRRALLHNIVVFNDSDSDVTVMVWAGPTKTLAYKVNEETLRSKQEWEPLARPIVLNESEALFVESDVGGVVSLNIFGSLMLDES